MSPVLERSKARICCWSRPLMSKSGIFPPTNGLKTDPQVFVIPRRGRGCGWQRFPSRRGSKSVSGLWFMSRRVRRTKPSSGHVTARRAAAGGSCQRGLGGRHVRLVGRGRVRADPRLAVLALSHDDDDATLALSVARFDLHPRPGGDEIVLLLRLNR